MPYTLKRKGSQWCVHRRNKSEGVVAKDYAGDARFCDSGTRTPRDRGLV